MERQGEDGGGETQGTYWTMDYLLISCSEWMEGVDLIFLSRKDPSSTSFPASNFSLIL